MARCWQGPMCRLHLAVRCRWRSRRPILWCWATAWHWCPRPCCWRAVPCVWCARTCGGLPATTRCVFRWRWWAGCQPGWPGWAWRSARCWWCSTPRALRATCRLCLRKAKTCGHNRALCPLISQKQAGWRLPDGHSLSADSIVRGTGADDSGGPVVGGLPRPVRECRARGRADSPKTNAAHYNDTVVRQFSILAVVVGVVGMLVGVIIAAQLAWPELNFGIPWLSYGRLRPLHTNAVIFGFGGSALFATSYYVVQRTCQVRLFAGPLAAFTFWGWVLVIAGAVISLPMGYTQGKEYAELEWPIDILITLVWVYYAIVFFGTIGVRKVKHIYVANWFFGAFILAVALLHVVNSAAIPADLMKSYSAYAGVQDAMVQWWYGHNAVGFFLTAGFLGMMYYFIPKQAGRPVYSYRLSIVHFWALIFTYMWAGPHHLHYT